MTREEAIKELQESHDMMRSYNIDESESRLMTALNMAIQALSQEPCTDAVSRQAVIYYIKGHIHEIITESGTDKNAHTNSILRALINGVETMPSVTQKSGKWIPVSERLPEDGTYLVTVERIVGRPNIEIKSFAKDLNKVDEFDFPEHKSGWYDYDSEYGYWEDTRVIAWTLPPKPYEPQESEDKK